MRDSINEEIEVVNDYQIKEIIRLMNNSEESPVKMSSNYRLDFFVVDSFESVRLLVRENRFKYRGKSYISKENIEEYLKAISIEN